MRTNRVHVVTSPVNIPRIEQLLKEYDADTALRDSPVRRAVEISSAREEILPILVQALTEPGCRRWRERREPDRFHQPRPTGTRSSGSTASGSVQQPQQQQQQQQHRAATGAATVASAQEGLDTQPVDTTPTEATVGNTKIIADQRNNTIILLGGAGGPKDKVFEVLEQLDVRSPQVVIRTVIGELSITDGKEFGLNYLLRSNRGSVLSQFQCQPRFLPMATTSDTGTTTGTDPTTTV